MFFGIITPQAIRRGSFDSVKKLVDAIRAFIAGWNERCHPFTWTKTADEILPTPPLNEIQTRDPSRAKVTRTLPSWTLAAARGS